jgi:hypothetical protein
MLDPQFAFEFNECSTSRSQYEVLPVAIRAENKSFLGAPHKGEKKKLMWRSSLYLSVN